MNLRRKTLLILGLTLILSVAVIICFSYTVLLGSYVSFEEKNTRASVNAVLKAIDYKISLIEKTCGDWSRWDETYQFVTDQDPTYIERNLNNQTFDNLGIGIMVFAKTNREIVYASGFNRSSHHTYPVSDDLLQILLSTDYLFSHEQMVSSRSGILTFPSAPLLVVSEPVLQSTYEGPSVGYLIMGTYLSDEEIGTISEITSQNFTIVPAETYMSSGPASPSTIGIRVNGPDTITGYTLLPEINGNPRYFIEVTSDRSIFNQGLVTIGSYIVLLVIISIVLVVTMLITIDRLVLQRLAIIIGRARTRNAVFLPGSDPLLDNGDELSELAFALNPVFTRIIQSEQELLKSEARYRSIVESRTDFVYRFTPDGRYIFANQAYLKYIGMTEDELLKNGFIPAICPDDQPLVRNHFASLTRDNPVATIEYRIIMRSGEVRWQQWTDLAMVDPDGTILEYQSIGRDITDKKQSQEDLEQANEHLSLVLEDLTASEEELKESLKRSEESEKKYRDLADSLPEFVFEIDTEGKITFLNKLGFEVSGYTPEDLRSGLDAQVLVAPEDRTRLTDHIQRILAGQRISGDEYTGYRRDGSRLPMVMYCIRVEDEGVVYGIRGFAIDITERKRMEASNRKLADIVKHTRAGIMTGSEDIVDVINPAYATMHGYSPEEIASIPAYSLFSPELQKEFPGYLKKAEVLGHVLFEADHLHRDGTLIPTLNVLTVITDSPGAGQYWILNVQDITEHQLAWKILMESESLRESHRQLRDVISRLPDATFVIDKDGWVILWNSAMEQLTGIQSESIIGRGRYEYSIPFYGEKRPLLIDIILDDSIDKLKYYSDIRRNGDTLSVEEFVPNSIKGPMYLSSVANPIFNAKGRMIGAIESIRDISSIKRVEDSLLKANEKLNLLSSITRHDIRNRITVLFGILPIIKGMNENPDMVEMLDLLERAAYAIRDQIEFTRDYQDLGVFSPEWKNAGEILDLISLQLQLTEIRFENMLHG